MQRFLDDSVKKILVVTPDQINYDSVCASIVLTEILEDLGKEVTLLTNVDKFAKIFKSDIDQGSLNLRDTVESQSFVAKLPADREVDDIKVNRDGDFFNIVINTKGTSLLDNSLTFEKGEAEFDLIILLGFSEIDNNEEFKSLFMNSVTAKKTMLIHYTESNIKTNSELIIKSSSLSETVKIIASKLKVKLDTHQSTKLLTGIFFNTKNLKINTDNQTIKSVHLLVNQDEANVFKANQTLHKDMSKLHVLWHNEIFKNIKTHETLCYSFVSNEEITSDFIGSLSREEKMPISRIQGCDTSVVIVKLDENIHGFVQTKSNRSAVKLTEDFFQLGDKNYAYFWTDLSGEEVIKNIFEKMKTEKIQEKTVSENDFTIEEKSEEQIETETTVTPAKNLGIEDNSSEINLEVEETKKEEISTDDYEEVKTEIKPKQPLFVPNLNDKVEKTTTKEEPSLFDSKTNPEDQKPGTKEKMKTEDKQPIIKTAKNETIENKTDDFSPFVPPSQQRMPINKKEETKEEIAEKSPTPKRSTISPDKLEEIKRRMGGKIPQRTAKPRQSGGPSFVPPGYNPLPAAGEA